MRKSGLCQIRRCAKQRLDREFDSPALALVLLLGPMPGRLRAPVDEHLLAEDEELVAPERAKTPSELKESAEVIVEEL